MHDLDLNIKRSNEETDKQTVILQELRDKITELKARTFRKVYSIYIHIYIMSP